MITEQAAPFSLALEHMPVAAEPRNLVVRSVEYWTRRDIFGPLYTSVAVLVAGEGYRELVFHTHVTHKSDAESLVTELESMLSGFGFVVTLEYGKMGDDDSV